MASIINNRLNDFGFGIRQNRTVVAGRVVAYAVAAPRHLALWHHLWAVACECFAMKRPHKQATASAARLVDVSTSATSSRAAAMTPREATVSRTGTTS